MTTVQTLLLQIDETKQNARIVEAFKMGKSQALVFILSKNYFSIGIHSPKTIIYVANIISPLLQSLGTTTLKNALGDKNITVDNVEDALSDVKEILETNADIQFALSGAQFNDIINDGTDDETLELELMDLLEDNEQQDANSNAFMKQSLETKPEQGRNLSNGLSKPNSPTTITNVIDELLEERLNKLKLDICVDSSDNPQIKIHDTAQQL